MIGPSVSRSATAFAVLAALALGLALAPPAADAALTRVSVNGVSVPVSFNDGDSFRIQGGEFSGSQCRLAGFNTLESFGPAHWWGDWHPYELYVNAKMATTNGRRGTWHCTTDGTRDGYGRLLLECPDLAISQISQGLAHAMQIDDTFARPEYLRAQQEAIAHRRGMWAHGVPEFVMTSIHSASEGGRDEYRNRLVSVRDAHTEYMTHNDTYSECQWVCASPQVADEPQLLAAARALRADPAIAPLVGDFSNLLLMEFASRFARLGELPEYLADPARTPVQARLAALRSAGSLSAHQAANDTCMLFVEFTRRYGRERAACLRGHGARPGETPH